MPTSAGSGLSAAAHGLVEAFVTRSFHIPTAATEDRPKSWYVDKVIAEAACVLPAALALRASKAKMPDGGLAEKMMDHFLSGSAEPVHIDLNVELGRNPQLREYVASHIEFELAQRAKKGGGTYFEYQIVGSHEDGDLEVQLNVSDHYFWSPSETERPTHCLHVCGAKLVQYGDATEFYQEGEGGLVVRDPTRGPPMTPLEIEPKDSK